MSELLFKKEIKRPDYTLETISIYYDEGSESPREWSNNTEIVCTKSHKYISDKQMDKYDLRDLWENKEELNETYKLVFPLYRYEHGGAVLSIEPFHCPWDSGQIGFVGVTHENYNELRKYYESMTDEEYDAQMETEVKSDIKVLDAWQDGRVYRFDYSIVDWDDNVIEQDSCGGFYALKDMSDYLDDRIMGILREGIDYFDQYKL